MTANVALVRGDDRYNNIVDALALVQDELPLADCRRVVIKPNLVSTTRQEASTHVDAIRAVLDVLRMRYNGPIIIAEGSAVARTCEGFERFGYTALARQYNVDLCDLNADATIAVPVYDRALRPQTVRLARTIVESDMRISVGPPKTHDTVIVTLSLKNMIMGALVNRALRNDAPPAALPPRLARLLRRATGQLGLPPAQIERFPLGEPSDKLAMHQGYPAMNLNLALLAPLVRPHLSVIDGFTAMEGSGPVDGEPVAWRVALAGTDALAVDTLTATLMGMNPAEVGYLSYCRALQLGEGDPHAIRTLGHVTPDEVRRTFRLHPRVAQQRAWQIADAARYLQAA